MSVDEEYIPPPAAPKTKGIDPDTDNEAGVKKPKVPTQPKTRKVWVSRSPAWRRKPVSLPLTSIPHANWHTYQHIILLQARNMLVEVDAEVVAQQAKDATGRGNTHTIRRRGPTRSYKDTKLPSLRGKSFKRIPRSMVDPGWLRSEWGAKYDKRTLISDDEGDSEGDGEGGNSGGGDVGGNAGEDGHSGDDGDGGEDDDEDGEAKVGGSSDSSGEDGRVFGGSGRFAGSGEDEAEIEGMDCDEGRGERVADNDNEIEYLD